MRRRPIATPFSRVATFIALVTLLAGGAIPAFATEPGAGDGAAAAVRAVSDRAAFRPLLEPPLEPTALARTVFARNLVRPTAIIASNDGTGHVFIVEQPGRVRVYSSTGDDLGIFLAITGRVNDRGGEQGLLGLAFDPGYASNGRFYVSYTNSAGSLVVGQYRRTSSTRASTTERRIIRITHPGAGNHNGGNLAFGRDNYLYISTGDGGQSGDPPNNAQNRRVLLGKILRIKPTLSGSTTYTTAGNPYQGHPTFRRQIWAYGLRNVWRFSFDRGTGDLWLADVGQGSREEVDHVTRASGNGKGRNFGWRQWEGDQCFRGPCTRAGKVFPITTYGHGTSCSITGGYVYRGSASPAWAGRYIFGDFCSGKIWWVSSAATSRTTRHLISDTSMAISAFGQDEAGELLVADRDGIVYRLQFP